jgi:NAD(P)-dependent dehydrogenase (short-subunit alcohol dehydrogenase family)
VRGAGNDRRFADQSLAALSFAGLRQEENRMRLANKVALITGAGSGMGRAAAVLFASEGAKVAAADISQEGANETVREITANGGQGLALRADVSKSADVQRMVETAVERFGTLNVLYNNAGIEGESAFLARMPEEAFDQVIAINLRGVFLGMKYALPHLIKAGGGSIINTASIAGLIGVRGGVGYAAAKAGVIAMTRVAAVEYGRYNIRVNAICPGAIETPMAVRIRKGVEPKQHAINRISLLERMGRPEEIARMALFLASEEGSFATGAPFVVDGGWTVT